MRDTSVYSVFFEALRKPDLSPPAVFGSHPENAPLKRFNVYRNNVMVSLIEALKSQFPVVLQLVGQEYFEALAKLYVQDTLPRSPVLFTYGDTFPDFLGSFPPLAAYAYLPDIALLEWHRTQTLHAADAPPLTAEAFQGVSDFESYVFIKHPAARLLATKTDAFGLWISENGLQDKPKDLYSPSYGLLTRPFFESILTPLTAQQYRFFHQAFEGVPFGKNVGTLLEEGFDLPTCLGLAFESGAFTPSQQSAFTHSQQRAFTLSQ